MEYEKKACQYYFAVNSNAQLENDDTLIHLIEANRFVAKDFLIPYALVVEISYRINLE